MKTPEELADEAMEYFHKKGGQLGKGTMGGSASLSESIARAIRLGQVEAYREAQDVLVHLSKQTSHSLLGDELSDFRYNSVPPNPGKSFEARFIFRGRGKPAPPSSALAKGHNTETARLSVG